jgi:acyl-CoA hydrolase
MTELVLPNDTNTFGNLMGGRLMYWMDIASALAAMKHCGTPVVTASVDNISFESPIKLGMILGGKMEPKDAKELKALFNKE